jgi:P27 family predicted phage terminase small subunit
MPRTAKAALAVPRVDAKPERLAPPKELSAAERAIWMQVVSGCKQGHFQASDAPLLVAYCQSIAQHARAIKALAKEGDVTANGKVNPWALIQEKAGRAIATYAARLRCSPQARSQYVKAADARPMSYYDLQKLEQENADG